MQPNGITFIARQWGDEFFSWFETSGGYRIYQAADGWYYYAKLDMAGEFAGSTSRVGIDPPLASAYKLERSTARVSEIQQWKNEFGTRYARPMQEAKENIRRPMTATPETLKIAIILVEFTDSVHYNPNVFPRIGGYLKSDFEKEFFSSNNEWFDTSQGNGTPHPENDKVFGSFRDYWNQMSLGKLIITGQMVNPIDPVTGVPKWIRLSYNWTHYYNSLNQRELGQEGVSKAQDSGYISSIPGQPNYYHKKIVIYAGKAYAYGALKVAAEATNGSFTWIGERTGRSIYYENTAFLHIGTPSHEFGHLIGFYDEYTSHYPISQYDLMDYGIYNGPLTKGECPASLSPLERTVLKTWVTPVLLTSDATNFVATYDYQNPKLYRINPFNRDVVNDEHYIFEVRLRKGFDLYLPNSPDNAQYQPGNVLIWHLNYVDAVYEDWEYISLKAADNTVSTSSFRTDFFPKDSVQNQQSFNDITTPKATIGDGSGAHFALNGIHRHKPTSPSDSDYAKIDTVALKLTLASGTIAQNTSWQYNVRLVSDVTVPNGVTLTVLPGASVKSYLGYALNINGKLIANGTSSSRITFTSDGATPAPGDWWGIYCSGGGPDTLTFCDIKYAETGLWLQNTAANSYMQNDTVQYSFYTGYGVYVSNTGTANRSLRMYKCGIKSNDGIGLRVSNAKVSVSYSRIEDNGRQYISSGVYVVNGARVFFDSSRIQNNIGSGLKISGLGSRILLTPDSSRTGYNTVTQHGVSELYLLNSGSAFLGGGYGPGNYGGFNNVYNTSTYSCRLINNATSNQVSAKWTYWGSTGYRFCGPVDSSLGLGSPVNTPAVMEYRLPGDEILAVDGKQPSFNDWLVQLKNDVTNNNINAFDALHHLAVYAGPGGTYQNVVGTSWEDFLSLIEAKSTSAPVKSLASALLIQSKLDTEDFTNAIMLADNTLGKDIDDDLWVFCQTRKIFAHVGAGDIASAHSVLNDMRDRAEIIDSEAVKAMDEYIAMASKTSDGNRNNNSLVKNAFKQTITGPRAYFLAQNYPNPFNPKTDFRYQIADITHVSLKVYDVLGREIATLVDEDKHPGEYSATWDAAEFASGIYFYKLQAGKFSDIKKMLLIK